MKSVISTLCLSSLLCIGLSGCDPDREKNTGDSSSSGSTNQATASSSGSVSQQWVDAHNKYRKMHQVGNVSWSSKIAKEAEKFVANCPEQHSKSAYGENMAWGSYGDAVEKAVSAWYKEESKHDYSSNSYRGGVTGHFSQVVWKNTTQIGCAYNNKCKMGGLYTCKYNPAGNVSNGYTNNVFPQK